MLGGSRSDYRNEAFYNSNLNNFNPAFALISMVKIESKGPVFGSHRVAVMTRCRPYRSPVPRCDAVAVVSSVVTTR